MGHRLRCVLVVLSFTIFAASAAGAQADTLEVQGHSDLGGTGLNGQVATVGNTAVVASGILNAQGARTSYYVTYPCPPTTVKVVDVSTPSAPVVRSQIPIQALAVASDVDAIRVDTPTFDGVLLAVALVRCQNSTAGNATERGVAYYDITDPSNPIFLSRFNPDENRFTPADPPCSLAATARCASSNDNVSLVQRADGTVLSLSTEPASSNSQTNPTTGAPTLVAGCEGAGSGTGCAYRGDVRIVNVTNPVAPAYVGSYPNAAFLNDGVEQRPPGYTPPGGVPQRFPFSNNGCRNFQYGLSVGIKDNNTALVPFLDAGLLTADITNPASPQTIGRWSYGDDRNVEGNAAFVDPARVGGRDLALIGENDWMGVSSRLRIDGSSAIAGTKFACEAMYTLFDPEDTAQVYRKPNHEVPGGIVYVGRGCPGDALQVDASRIAGKIAFRDLARVPDREPLTGTNCSNSAAVLNLQEKGAVGVVVGNTSLVGVSPQAVSADGDPRVGPAGLNIPAYMIDTADANAMRDALCPVVAGGAGGCGPGGQTVSGAMIDSAGQWGGLRVIDVTNPAAPTLRGSYHPPGANTFPPPDLGVYSVHHAVASGSTGFVAAHSNGLRAIDLTSADPTDIAGFVPPDRVDPTGTVPAKANVVGVDVAENGAIVISDINAGMYVLRLKPTPVTPPPPPPPPPAAVPPPPIAVTPPPAAITRRPGRLTASVTPASDLRAPFRFRTFGRLTRPSGITQAAGCSGRVSVQIKRGNVTISTRRVTLSRTCTYSSRVTFVNSRRFARTIKRLKFTARFLGNTRISPSSATPRFARIRR